MVSTLSPISGWCDFANITKISGRWDGMLFGRKRMVTGNYYHAYFYTETRTHVHAKSGTKVWNCKSIYACNGLRFQTSLLQSRRLEKDLPQKHGLELGRMKTIKIKSSPLYVHGSTPVTGTLCIT